MDLARVWITVVLAALTVAGVLAIAILGISRLGQMVATAERAETATEVTVALRRSILALQDERALAELWLTMPSAESRAAYILSQDGADSALARLRAAWEIHRATLDEAGPPVLSDIVESTASLAGLREAILQGGEDSSIGAYTGMIDVMSGSAVRMDVLSGNSTLTPRIRALVRIMAAGEGLSELRDVVLEAITDETPMSQDELIRIALLEQHVRNNLGSIRGIGIGDVATRIGAFLGSLRSDTAQAALAKIGAGDEAVDPDDWYTAATQRLEGLQGVGDDLEQALVNEAEGLHASATRARLAWSTGLIVLTAVSALAGGAAIAAALQRSRALHEYGELASGLHTWFVPEGLALLDGVRVASRYDAVSEYTRAGGDWYDAYALADGRVALTVGDVAGHGAAATVHMAQARNLLRGITLASHGSPADQLQALDDALRGSGMMATVFHGLLDVEHGELTYSRAGHPVGLLRNGDSVTLLDDALGSPVGVESTTSYIDARVQLAPASQVVLFTDGLVEVRGQDIEEAISRAATRLATGPISVEEAADELILRRENREDDTALLVVSWVGLSAVSRSANRPTAPEPSAGIS